jgi:hypothetical protein
MLWTSSIEPGRHSDHAKPRTPIGAGKTSCRSERIPSVVAEACSYYQLDYFEVSPYRRRSGLGYALIAILACRAAECGCNGIVLGSLPGAVKFYETAGAIHGAPAPWLPDESCLLPFHFDADRLAFYVESANDYDDENGASE